MNIQWYPGHMTKAFRQMQEDMKLIDLCVVLLDARIPMSSQNPDIDKLLLNKSKIIVLTKSDLADEAVTALWISYFKNKGVEAVALDTRSKKDLSKIAQAVEVAASDKRARDAKRGIKNRPLRALVAGIPNVGKSTFINSYAGKACAKTGNKPGVTKGKQWIRLNKQLELLDTPGVLWPKFDDETVGLHLAFTGAINDDIIQTEELASSLIASVKSCKPGTLNARYNISEENRSAYDTLTDIAISRKCLKKGDEPDLTRAAKILIDDFRSGALGRISLERPVSDARK